MEFDKYKVENGMAMPMCPVFKGLSTMGESRMIHEFNQWAQSHHYAVDESLTPGEYEASVFDEPVWQSRFQWDACDDSDDYYWISASESYYKQFSSFKEYERHCNQLLMDCRQYLPLKQQDKIESMKSKPENKCAHDSLESVTALDGKDYEICYQCGYSSLPKSKVADIFEQPDKVVGSVPVKTPLQILAEGQCVNLLHKHFLIHSVTIAQIITCMEAYASQFQNNNAVSIIEAEREKLKFSSDPAKCKTGVEILSNILKLLKP